MSDNPYQSPESNELVQVVQASCFTGFTVGGWTDEFAFFVPYVSNLKQKIHSFYVGKRARLVQESEPMAFVRGSRLWSLLGLTHERMLLQRIRVSLDRRKTITRVTLQYRVFVSFGLRTPPFPLRPEAESLASQLEAIADPAIDTSG